MYTIRTAEQNDIADLDFVLFDEDNDGEEILVAVTAGQIVAFAQLDGNQIYFLESNAPGAGTAIVTYLKAEYETLTARNCDRKCAPYWEHQGFERGAKSERSGEYDFDWFAS